MSEKRKRPSGQISSSAVSRAATSPTLASEPAWKVIDRASGSRWQESFASLNPEWSSSKMSQDSCDPWREDQGSLLSESSSLIWPNSGMTLDGVAYRLPMWELHIYAAEFSSSLGFDLLPTPSATDANGAETPTAKKARGAGGAHLQDLPKLLPSPAATDHKGGVSEEVWDMGRRDRHPGSALRELTNLLPTPVAEDSRGTPEQHLARKNKDGFNRTTVTSLGILVKTLPTPNLEDAFEVIKESTGESSSPPSGDGNSSSPEVHPDQLMIGEDSMSDFASGCSASQKDGSM